MTDLFLAETDFPNHSLFRKTEIDLIATLFDLKSRGARCRGIVSYMFEKGGELQEIEELICQFGDIDQAARFMQDEREVFERIGKPIDLDLTDDAMCLIKHEIIAEEGKVNMLRVWCTVRDDLIVVRLSLLVNTIGFDLRIPFIEKYAGRALLRTRQLKV